MHHFFLMGVWTVGGYFIRKIMSPGGPIGQDLRFSAQRKFQDRENMKLGSPYPH